MINTIGWPLLVASIALGGGTSATTVPNDRKAIVTELRNPIDSMQRNEDPAAKFSNSLYIPERNVLMLLRNPAVRLITLKVTPSFFKISISGEKATALVRERLVMVVSEAGGKRSRYVVNGLYQNVLNKERMLSPTGEPEGPPRWQVKSMIVRSSSVTKEGQPISMPLNPRP